MQDVANVAAETEGMKELVAVLEKHTIGGMARVLAYGIQWANARSAEAEAKNQASQTGNANAVQRR